MYKNLLTLSIFLALASGANAQSDTHRKSQHLMHKKRVVRAACPKAYIGVSTGINNPVGFLGVQVDVALSSAVSLGSGVGYSTWGYKTFLEGRYYFKPCNRGWAIGSGFTYNTGFSNFLLTDQETIVGNSDIRITQKSQVNFMLSGYHFFNIGHSGRNRFHLQAGFSIPLSEVEFTQVGGPPVTQKTYDGIKGIAPGGLIVGLGFSFGLGG